MSNRCPERIYARYQTIHQVSVVEICQMYELFRYYYGGTDAETFLSDLSGKHGVILVRTRRDHRIVGFSTIVSLDMKVGRILGRGIFSGDTILEEAYRGTRKLQLAFYRYLIQQKLRQPFRPVLWLLISKGYKTYLLLANNFARYYPNPEWRHRELSDVIDQYCGEMFPGYLDTERRVLDFGQSAQHLADGVAEVTEELRQRHEKIRFFEQCNPTWKWGTELPCVGVVDARTLVGFASKAVKETVTKKTGRSA